MSDYINYIEKVEKLVLPTLPMRGMVAFPGIPISFEATRDISINALKKADDDDSYVFLVAQKEISADNPSADDLYNIGTVAKIKQSVKLPDGNIRLIVEGICRGTANLYDFGEKFISASIMCKTINLKNEGSVKEQALMREAILTFEKFENLLPKLSSELILAVKSIKSPGVLADFIASNVLIKYLDKQLILNEYEPLKRLETLIFVLESEIDILNEELTIHKKVKSKIESNQREYYLKEQLKVIQNELNGGSDDESDDELEELYDKIYSSNLPEEVEEKLLKEVKKLSKTSFGSGENAVIRNYLELCLELPWSKTTKDRIDIESARKILDDDHDGLEKVKERIIEFLAVKQLNSDIKNQILCLVGPPGVGKTSIAASIAKAMKRKYVRVSLGGIRDEADIRGHRKTYVGSMPGRIINALKQAGVRNPLILLDEIDKLSYGSNGDPASALLEVLDSEQNKAFRDHFVELPIDLSDCLFIATANTLETVSRPLIDRMEIITLKIYTRHEKLQIAKNHLIPKQMKRHGLNKRMLKIDDDTIIEIIDFYTREAGVRNLEREIGNLCRKIAKIIVEKKVKSCKISSSDVKKYLGNRKVKPETISNTNEIGVVNGLAYTEVGGDILKIEVAVMPGTGKIELTGSLGDVMKESAKTAISYIRAKANVLGIDSDFYKNKDIHIHVPEGATPKDGPSAGITIVTALASELCQCPVYNDVAMTGEVTLRGNILPIGGLKEKTMAAYKAGVKTIIISEDNVQDLDDIDPIVRENIKFIPCSKVDDVLRHAILFDESRKNFTHIECKNEHDTIINIIPEISNLNDTVPISCNK